MEQSETTQKSTFSTRFRAWYHGLPDKKRYLEFITALLSIPVLVTVIISNMRTLSSQQKAAVTPTSIPATTIIIQKEQAPAFSISPTKQAGMSATPTVSSAQCKKGVGPVAIIYPKESDLVSGDPVCLEIGRQSDEYCGVVWSYRINTGAWSDYMDKSICMYGLSSGQKVVDLRVRSVASTDEITLTRTFTIAGTATPTSTPATSSAVTQ